MLEIIYTPYTYLIGWKHYNIYYYGCQYGYKTITANPQNLWKTYFTSSPYVKEAIEQYGEPDIIEIRQTFTNGQKCQDWEAKVLRRMKVLHRTDFLNKNIRRSVQFDDVVRRKMAKKKTGRNGPRFKGIYITPLGEFESSHIASNIISLNPQTVNRYCRKDNTMRITKGAYSKSKFLKQFDESIIGKTYKDIGFGFRES